MKMSSREKDGGLLGPWLKLEIGFVGALGVGALIIYFGDAVIAQKGEEPVSDAVALFLRQWGNEHPGGSRLLGTAYIVVELLYLVYFIIGLVADLGPKALDEDVEAPVWRIYGILIGFMVVGGGIWIFSEALDAGLFGRWAGGAITVLGPPCYFTWLLFRRAQQEAQRGIGSPRP